MTGDDEETGPETATRVTADAALTLVLGPEAAGQRLDRALADAAAGIPGLSRSRLAQLIAGGAVTAADGTPATDQKRKARDGECYRIALPPPEPAAPEPEAIPLTIAYEDGELLVVDKPAGMVVHPAPGAERGTLVNALLAHCGDSLSGIGGTRRPGIVHRIDKDTSGLLVVAKTQAAHEGLADQFRAHSVARRYLAVCLGAPDRADARLAGLPTLSFGPEGITVDAALDRHPTDRMRMAVARRGGKRAVTHLRLVKRFGSGVRPVAGLLSCRLETGRTHQIRVHAAHIGHPLIGDPVYGRKRALPKDIPQAVAEAITDFPRQALHAAHLGFTHPISGAELAFESPAPADMKALEDALAAL